MMRRLSFRLSNSVVWESQKLSIIRKKTRLYFLVFISTYRSIKTGSKRLESRHLRAVSCMDHLELEKLYSLEPVPLKQRLKSQNSISPNFDKRIFKEIFKATFLKLAGPQLVQMFIGDGAKLVRDAFTLAKEKAPTIIFIDELDAIGTKRFDSEKAGDREVQRTMLELLNQLDGFAPSTDIKGKNLFLQII